MNQELYLNALELNATACRFEQLDALGLFRRGWSRAMKDIDDTFRERSLIPEVSEVNPNPIDAFIGLVNGRPLEFDRYIDYIRRIAGAELAAGTEDFTQATVAELPDNKAKYAPPRAYTLASWIFSQLEVTPTPRLNTLIEGGYDRDWVADRVGLIIKM